MRAKGQQKEGGNATRQVNAECEFVCVKERKGKAEADVCTQAHLHAHTREERRHCVKMGQAMNRKIPRGKEERKG